MRELKKIGGSVYPLIVIGIKQKLHDFIAEEFDRQYKRL